MRPSYREQPITRHHFLRIAVAAVLPQMVPGSMQRIAAESRLPWKNKKRTPEDFPLFFRRICTIAKCEQNGYIKDREIGQRGLH
jgi:hypothetical protein